nr:alpha-N-acetylgalactosaminide alpha-2,6-sialyltransferase 2 isoform X2 [Solea senegalensis]
MIQLHNRNPQGYSYSLSHSFSLSLSSSCCSFLSLSGPAPHCAEALHTTDEQQQQQRSQRSDDFLLEQRETCPRARPPPHVPSGGAEGGASEQSRPHRDTSAMARMKRTVLGMLTVSFVVSVYLLRGNLEETLSWSLVPLSRFHGYIQGRNSSQDSEEPVDRNTSRNRPSHPEFSSATFLRPNPRIAPTLESQTPVAKTQRAPAENEVPSVSKATSKSDEESRTLKRGPTDPPFIGDTYTSEDIPPQTNCPDGIQGHVAETEFGGRFLKHIPVLQWAKHVSPEQHQRLSKYTGAHGWGGLDYATLVETLSVLNSSVNRQMFDDWKNRSDASLCIHCAVVGNGGILKYSKKGQEIDSHHYVFRTNGAITQGFEQDVGSRTTHYTFSTNTLMNSLNSYAGVGYRRPPHSEETRYVFLPDHDRDYLLMKAAATHTRVEQGRERNRDPTTLFGTDVSAEKLKMYHPDFIRYLRNRFLRSNTLKTSHKNIYRPSTGAVMLLAALHTCDQVSAYGFMTPDYMNYSDHYYDSSYHAVAFYSNHDLRLEMSLWQQLHRAGLIRLFMHQ